MQFGRKSEKLERQIEQLQLRLEALEMIHAEKVAALAPPAKSLGLAYFFLAVVWIEFCAAAARPRANVCGLGSAFRRWQ